MKVKDQLRMRRTQLGISVVELAKRLGVSAQAVRHWENGRSFPGKSKTSALESALSFSIDWTEGARAAAKRPNVSSLIDANDVALLIQIARLPPPAKALIGDLVQMHLEAIGMGAEGLDRIKESSARPFHERENQAPILVPLEHKSFERGLPRRHASDQQEPGGVVSVVQESRSRKKDPLPSKQTTQRHSTRRKAA